jgi:hypothetical protein
MEEGRTARIAPGSRREIGVVNAAIARLLGLATGGRPPHIFTTLARHRGLFRRWLWFVSGLMPGGKLPRSCGLLTTPLAITSGAITNGSGSGLG